MGHVALEVRHFIKLESLTTCTDKCVGVCFVGLRSLSTLNPNFFYWRIFIDLQIHLNRYNFLVFPVFTVKQFKSTQMMGTLVKKI